MKWIKKYCKLYDRDGILQNLKRTWFGVSKEESNIQITLDKLNPIGQAG